MSTSTKFVNNSKGASGIQRVVKINRNKWAGQLGGASFFPVFTIINSNIRPHDARKHDISHATPHCMLYCFVVWYGCSGVLRCGVVFSKMLFAIDEKKRNEFPKMSRLPPPPKTQAHTYPHAHTRHMSHTHTRARAHTHTHTHTHTRARAHHALLPPRTGTVIVKRKERRQGDDI